MAGLVLRTPLRAERQRRGLLVWLPKMRRSPRRERSLSTGMVGLVGPKPVPEMHGQSRSGQPYARHLLVPARIPGLGRALLFVDARSRLSYSKLAPGGR